MFGSDKDKPAPQTLIDECFATQSDQFIDQLRTVRSSRYLAALAERWKKDPRPWAREQIVHYLSRPLDRPGHQTVVKRLFKQAEANRDHALMGEFAVAFDRLIRRRREISGRWDFNTRTMIEDEVLATPRDQIVPIPNRSSAKDRWRDDHGPYVPKNGKLFSYRTRDYLRRRAWRYFRRLAFQQTAEYALVVARFLSIYRDEDFAKGENILDNWSLMHAAFGVSPAIRFTRNRVNVAEGRSLGELSAAPRFAPLWKTPEAATLLFELIGQAKSRLVRVWAITLLKRDHANTVAALTPEQLLALLDHEDSEVQQFGASLLETHQGIDSWPITIWLQLLKTQNTTVLATICHAMSQRVKPERLNLSQCVDLAISRATPVARLGFDWIRTRSITGFEDRRALVRLAESRCEAIGVDVARFSLSILETGDYLTDDAIAFFDSLNAEVRRGAWEWLTPASKGYNDGALWSRLLETPYDDVRIRLVNILETRSQPGRQRPAIGNSDLAAIWPSVLLAVHRGGRAKLTALRQITRALADHPDRANQLLPVVAVAIRSVRPTEARAGLAAILTAVASRPELEPLLAEHIPELRLTAAGGVP